MVSTSKVFNSYVKEFKENSDIDKSPEGYLKS